MRSTPYSSGGGEGIDTAEVNCYVLARDLVEACLGHEVVAQEDVPRDGGAVNDHEWVWYRHVRKMNGEGDLADDVKARTTGTVDDVRCGCAGGWCITLAQG